VANQKGKCLLGGVEFPKSIIISTTPIPCSSPRLFGASAGGRTRRLIVSRKCCTRAPRGLGNRASHRPASCFWATGQLPHKKLACFGFGLHLVRDQRVVQGERSQTRKETFVAWAHARRSFAAAEPGSIDLRRRSVRGISLGRVRVRTEWPSVHSDIAAMRAGK